MMTDDAIRRVLSCCYDIQCDDLPMGRAAMPVLMTREDRDVAAYHDTDDAQDAERLRSSYEALDRMREIKDRRSQSVVGELTRRMGPRYRCPGEDRPDGRQGVAKILKGAINAIHEGEPPVGLFCWAAQEAAREWRVTNDSPWAAGGPEDWVTRRALNLDRAVASLIGACEQSDEATRTVIAAIGEGQFDDPALAAELESLSQQHKDAIDRLRVDREARQDARTRKRLLVELESYIRSGSTADHIEERKAWLRSEIERLS